MPKNRRHATTAAPVAPEAPERSPLPEDEEAAPAAEPTAALIPVDSLQRYLTDIRRIPVLSREEEHRLALRWHDQGDRDAAWQLVKANLRLDVMIAGDFQRALPNPLGLAPEGSVQLLKAMKTFGPYRGN